MGSIRNDLIPKGRTIFFDEEYHKYSNELGFVYTSVTTIISKYTEDFKKQEIAKACERIGRNPNHKDYLKYKGYTAEQLIKKWEEETKKSCAFGSKTHNGLESSIKESTKYYKYNNNFIKDKIYTIDDIIENHNYGRLNITKLKSTLIYTKYPEIYNVLLALHKVGYNIYAEIGVYDDGYEVAGLIDILLINHKTKEFIILDWKTNKAPIKFESGYFKKLNDGRLDLNNFVEKNEYFEYPLNHICDSVGNHYTMQLSTYAYLVTTFGYKLKGLLLCHLRPIEQQFVEREYWEEEIKIHNINYLEHEAKLMLDDFKFKKQSQQGTIKFN